MKKSICISFNHFQYADGVARAAIGIANKLSECEGLQITLRPIYNFEDSAMSVVSSNVIVKPVFGFYFNGMAKLVNRLPKAFLHHLIFGHSKYDIEIGFQHGTSTIAVVSGPKDRTKHLVWIHGYDDSLALKDYYLKADQVVCVSKCNAERLAKEINIGNRVTYSYNLIDDKKIQSQGDETVDVFTNNCLKLVTVGRLSPEKGYLRLLDVLGKLKRDGFSFEMVFVGDGPLKQELISSCKKNNVENEVIFVGNQSNPHKYTSKADVFICSSYSEGYSTACTEAIMLGIPVITTKVSGAEEIIGDSEAGLIVENSNSGLYDGIKAVLQNPSIVNQWKDTLIITKSHFSIEERTQRLMNVLGLSD